MDHFENKAILDLIIKTPISFKDVGIPINKKSIDLRQDHGKEKLKKFSSMIVKEPYIVEVVNSAPFSPNSNKMTKWLGNGLIVVRFLDTDNRIGIVVKTIATTETEGLYLAADIEKKYG